MAPHILSKISSKRVSNQVVKESLIRNTLDQLSTTQVTILILIMTSIFY